MIRAFVAVDIPESIRRLLGELAGKIARLGLDARISKPEAIHLTLKFLGEIEESMVDECSQLLAPAIAGTGSFEVQVRGLGTFPGGGVPPRVLWVGILSSPSLASLQKRVEIALEGAGFPAEDRAFAPHLTLARIKSRRNVEELNRFIEREGRNAEIGGQFPVRSVHLYQSLLKPDGAVYRKLQSFSLED